MILFFIAELLWIECSQGKNPFICSTAQLHDFFSVSVKMHPESLMLVEHLAVVVEAISNDVGNISLSLSQINHDFPLLGKQKGNASTSPIDLRDRRIKDISHSRVHKFEPDLLSLVERIAIAIETIPSDVKSISLSLKEINESVTSLAKEKVSVRVSSVYSRDSSDDEACDALAMSSIPETSTEGGDNPSVETKSWNSAPEPFSVHKSWSSLPVQAILAAGDEEEIHPFGESPPGKTRDSWSSQYTRKESETQECRSHEGERSVEEENPGDGSKMLHLHSYRRVSKSTDILKRNVKKGNKGKTNEDDSKPKIAPNIKGKIRRKRAIRFASTVSMKKEKTDFVEKSTEVDTPLLEESDVASSDDKEDDGEWPGEKELLRKLKRRSSSVKSSSEEGGKQIEGKKTFLCEACGKCFLDNAHLVRHRRVHTGEKPFQCSVCKKAYTQKSILITHMRTHSGERPFCCSACGKTFNQSGLLNVHMRTHSGEKPFQCRECGRSFAQSNTLAQHMRTHTGERPFGCSVCGKCFSQAANLHKHRKRVHKVTPTPLKEKRVYHGPEGLVEGLPEQIS